MNPKGLLYTKDHEWLKISGDAGTIGITDHAQKELGEVVYVELPKVGDKFDAGETFGTVESVKAVSELFIPVAESGANSQKSLVLPNASIPVPR